MILVVENVLLVYVYIELLDLYSLIASIWLKLCVNLI